MTLVSLILIGAGSIALLGALLLLVCKSMLSNIDNVDEDDDGFKDKRDDKNIR